MQEIHNCMIKTYKRYSEIFCNIKHDVYLISMCSTYSSMRFAYLSGTELHTVMHGSNGTRAMASGICSLNSAMLRGFSKLTMYF